ncbi:MAG: LCP family protein [Selenomonadaceae bacterium]|nr:LCP family protein [Selenomonadaceae bacterium]
MRERLEARRQKILRKMRNRKLFWSFIICFFIVAGSLTHLGFNSDFTRIKENLVSKVKPETILPTFRKPTTIMLMGIDERKDDVGRSDTLMILNLSKDEASLLTIPRDTLVYIDRHGYQKINAAYAYGGAKLTRETVEDFLGIDVDYYVTINKSRFAEVIDAMGGVDIYVERDMHYEDPWDDDGGLYIDLKQGLQHLDGQTAIEFVRYRDSEGDVGRVRRQQAFMRACADKLSEPSMLIKLPELLGVAVNAIETDLNSGEMLEAAGSLKSAEAAGNIKTGTVPGWLQYIDGVSYLIPNAERLGKVMKKNLGFEVDKKHFEKLSYEYTPGNDADYYDVNFNREKDLRLMDSLERRQYNLSENEL